MTRGRFAVPIIALVLSVPGGLAVRNEFSPRDLPGLVAWYEARSLHGEQVKLSDGESVETWPDSSGNGHDLVAENRGLPALFRTQQVNELPLVIPQERSSFLVTEPFDLEDHTIVLVHAAARKDRALFSSDGNEQSGVVLHVGSGQHQLRRGLRVATYSLNRPPQSLAISVLTREAGVLGSIVNGVADTVQASSLEPLRVGRMFHIRLSRAAERDAREATFAEILFFDRKLGDDELAQLTRYLSTRYAIEIELGSQPTEAAPSAATDFDWKAAEVLAQLSTVSTPDLNLLDGVAIAWDGPAQVAGPLQHDAGGQPSRLICTRDATRVRLAVQLEVTAETPGSQLRILARINGEHYVGAIETTRVTSAEPGEGRSSGRLEVSLQLDSGDYVEVVVAQQAGPGKMTPIPLNSFLLAALE